MRATVVQFNSGSDLDVNVARMRKWLEQAAKEGSRLVAFPEHATLYAERALWEPSIARFDELKATFAGWAKEFGVFLLPGSVREPVRGKPDRFYNTALFFGPDGTLVGQYRKIFLFQAKMPDRSYREADDCEAGNQIVTAPLEPAFTGRLGLSICYDLRFPELFRALKSRGATVMALPSAFTVPTGQAHWDLLTRARAVENQVFFLAPGQVGVLGNGAHTYGHSRIVAPWGEVLAEVKGEAEGLASHVLDPDLLTAARAKVDAWESRRPDLFPIA